MIAAARTYPETRDAVKLVAVDPASKSVRLTRLSALPRLLRSGDLIVVNDAATLPAALRGHDDQGRALELRLLAALGGTRFRAVLFGPGSWRERTEDRAPPPRVASGARLTFGALSAAILRVSVVSPRLCDVELEGSPSRVWTELYRAGKPVQYSHLAHELPLWAVQTVYAGRPWALEMPSAGRPLSWELLFALQQRGVEWASLTHAAGLSATGDATLDRALPLAERFELPESTVAAVDATRRDGGRVIAVGTTVVRALEGAAAQHGGRLVAGAGETSLRLDARWTRRICDGLLCGLHERGESHFTLLSAFADPALLDDALRRAGAAEFHSHELGDAMLIVPGGTQE